MPPTASEEPKSPPQLPLGNDSTLQGLGQNLSFHASPESFILGRILQYHRRHPNQVKQRTTIRAKILNRNVAVVSSYRHAREVLNWQSQNSDGPDTPLYVAADAYQQLMEQFFPQPNLLLQDGCSHAREKNMWKRAVEDMTSLTDRNRVIDIAQQFFDRVPEHAELDLYDILKTLSWRLLLSTFLGLTERDKEYENYIKLQEQLLRGQFSLLPVSINTGFWRSPHKVGVDARKKLQNLISDRIESIGSPWPHHDLQREQRDATINHILMATSSLAVKACASLLTAIVLNMCNFKMHDTNQRVLRDWIAAASDEQGLNQRLQATLLETARLSPPIVGIMRRATQDTTLSAPWSQGPDVMLPKGWDVWIYFAGANRDPATFENPDIFDPRRYALVVGEDTSRAPSPIVFGLGAKECLGGNFVMLIAATVMEVIIKQGINLRGEIRASGVRAWLGWETAQPEQWAKDMKQLPSQRPTKPVLVRCTRNKTVN